MTHTSGDTKLQIKFEREFKKFLFFFGFYHLKKKFTNHQMISITY